MLTVHQTHYYWGPRGFHGDTLIWVQWGPASIGRYCCSVGEVIHGDAATGAQGVGR